MEVRQVSVPRGRKWHHSPQTLLLKAMVKALGPDNPLQAILNHVRQRGKAKRHRLGWQGNDVLPSSRSRQRVDRSEPDTHTGERSGSGDHFRDLRTDMKAKRSVAVEIIRMPCCGELQPVGATGQYHAYCETCRIPQGRTTLSTWTS